MLRLNLLIVRPRVESLTKHREALNLAAPQDDPVETEELSERIDNALQTLTQRERETVTLYFGLDPNQEPIKVTNSVRKIIAKAIRKLRHPSRFGQFRYLFPAD